jgi:hypothetical protein
MQASGLELDLPEEEVQNFKDMLANLGEGDVIDIDDSPFL